jgi:hypothetical protein
MVPDNFATFGVLLQGRPIERSKEDGRKTSFTDHPAL